MISQLIADAIVTKVEGIIPFSSPPINTKKQRIDKTVSMAALQLSSHMAIAKTLEEKTNIASALALLSVAASLGDEAGAKRLINVARSITKLKIKELSNEKEKEIKPIGPKKAAKSLLQKEQKKDNHPEKEESGEGQKRKARSLREESSEDSKKQKRVNRKQ